MSMRSILSLVVLVILIAASSPAADESTPVRIVPDGLQKIEQSFVMILGQSSHVLSFARFAHKYEKKYDNEEEIKHRFSVFKENLDFIRSTNKKGLSYKLGVNQFADLTNQEFQRNQTTGAAQYNSATLKGRHMLTEAASVPETRDWRDDGIVSPVRNEASCGASYAFSAVGAVEAAYHQKYGIGTDLSEQQLIDCSFRVYGNHGCFGGVPSRAFDFINSYELILERDYKYIGVQSVCRQLVKKSFVNITKYVNITSGDEDELKRAVGSIGPVSISFDTSQIRYYRSGVFTSNHCGNTLKDLNHFALAVGYGIEDGVPYWLIKNSWGESWGEKGYFKVEMGKNMCGVATHAAYPVVA